MKPIHGIKRQIDAYNDAINVYGKNYKYMLFWDIDEFLVSKSLQDRSATIVEAMDYYFERLKPNAAGIGINWLMFGSNGHERHPDGGVIENYTRCAEGEFERNKMVKVCVKPERVIGFVDPHLPWPLIGYEIENADGECLRSPNSGHLPEDKSIRIHHYFLKSKEDFAQKVNKGFADRIDSYSMTIFEKFDRNECYNDDCLKVWEKHL